MNSWSWSCQYICKLKKAINKNNFNASPKHKYKKKREGKNVNCIDAWIS